MSSGPELQITLPSGPRRTAPTDLTSGGHVAAAGDYRPARPGSEWKWLVPTLVVSAGLAASAAADWQFDRPGLAYLVCMIAAGCFSSLRVSLVAAAIAVASTLIYLLGPWAPEATRWAAGPRLQVLCIAIPAVALALSMLKVRADRAAYRAASSAADLRVAQAKFEAELRYRAIVEAGHDGIWTLAPDHRTEFVNPPLAKLVGYTPEEMVGRLPTDFLFPEDQPAALKGLRASRSGIGVRTDLRLRCKDGSARWVIMSSKPLIGPRGDYLGGIAILSDITERKLAEQRLSRSEQQLRLALSAGEMGTWSWNERTDIGTWSPKVFEIFGLPYEDRPITAADWLERVHPDDRTLCRDTLNRALQQMAEPWETYRIVWPDGSIHWVESRAMIEWEGETPVAVSGLIFLIDERRKAERELREQAAQMRLAYKAGRMCSWVSDLVSKKQAWCPEQYELFGLPIGTLVDNDNWQKALHPADLATVQKALQRSLDQNEDYHAEYRIIQPDGTVRWIESHAVTERTNGVPVRFVGISQDVTERKHAAEALRISNERLRLTMQTARMGHWSVDGATGEIVWSPEVNALYGLPPTARPYRGEEWLKIVHPDDQARAAKDMQDAQTFEGEFATEYRIVWPDGSTHWLESRGHIERVGGRLSRIVGIQFNTDERHRAEDALRDSKEALAAVIDYAPVYVISGDADMVIRGWNPQAEHIFGYTAEEAIGKHLPDLKIIPADLYPKCEQMLRRALNGERVNFLEGKRLRRDGTTIDVNTSLAGLPALGTRPAGWMVIGTEVTEQRRLREQLLQSQRLESVGQLAGGIAHDFNNLIAIISGYAESLHRRIAGLGGDERALMKVGEIERAADRAAGLVKQLLAFSRRQTIEPRRLDLNEVIAGIRDMLLKLVGKSIALEVATSHETPTVLADPGQIEQVLLNLAINAKDAMPEGGTVYVETGRQTLIEPEAVALRVPPGEYAVVRVRDTGIGMTAETREHAFEPFFTTKGVNGTGLGLSVVHGIVSQAGGAISLQSAAGEGATFEILLPAITENQSTLQPDVMEMAV